MTKHCASLFLMIINAQGGESSSHFDISLVLIVLVSEIFEARFVLSSLHSKLEKSESNKPMLKILVWFFLAANFNKCGQCLTLITYMYGVI